MYISKVVVMPEDYNARIVEVINPILADKHFYILPNSHTAFIPKGRMIKEIETNYPEIKTILIKHEGLQTIEIDYTLRVPLFRLDNDLAVDTDGVVYQEPKDIDYLPMLTVKVNLPVRTELMNISSFAKKLGTTLGQVDNISIDENSDVTYAFLNSQSYLMTALKDNTETLWSTLISAITTDPLASTLVASKNSLLYIDLRYGNKVFYKFGKSGSISTTTIDNTLSTTTSYYDTRILAKPNR